MEINEVQEKYYELSTKVLKYLDREKVRSIQPQAKLNPVTQYKRHTMGHILSRRRHRSILILASNDMVFTLPLSSANIFHSLFTLRPLSFTISTQFVNFVTPPFFIKQL